MGDKRVVTYARCSTTKDQHPDAQHSELRRFCAARGWHVIREISDHGYSGSSDSRPGLKQLLQMVRANEVDAVVVVKLDRFFRSLKHVVVTLQEFSEIGIEFISIKDQIDLTTSAGRLMLHIISAFAEFERNLIRERTLAGLEFARASGKRLGRPQKYSPEEILQLRMQGLSYRAIEARLGCPAGVISAALRSARQSPAKQAAGNQANTGVENEQNPRAANGHFKRAEGRARRNDGNGGNDRR